MTAWNAAVLVLGVLGTLAFLGAWAEMVLMARFNHWYFHAGPTLRRLSAELDGGQTRLGVTGALSSLAWVAVRRVTGCELLIRRRVTVGPLDLGLPPIWSPRVCAEVREEDGRVRLSLEVRHPICWPVVAAVPAVGFAVALAVNPSLWFALLFLVGVALFAFPLWASTRTACRDAERIWELLSGPRG